MFDIKDNPYPGGPNPHEINIRDINIHYSGNNINHINPHLRYYPFECLICEEEFEKSRKRGDSQEWMKDGSKTAVKPMMRIHVKDKHFKDSNLERDQLEEQIDKSIRTLKVTELEKITKKQINTNVNKNISNKRKRKSIPGPLRETKSDSFPSVKQLRPIVPLFLNRTFVKLNGSDDLSNNLKASTFVTFPTQVLKSKPSIVFEIPAKVGIDFPKKVQSVNQILLNVETRPKQVNTEVINEQKLIIDEEILKPVIVSKDGKKEVFGCIFCHEKFQEYSPAFIHYLLHFNLFIECAKCSQKFTSVDKFRSHNSLHNENSNLLNLNKFKVIRKWIEKFLNFMINERKELIELTRDVTRVRCPVCLMVSNIYHINGKNDLQNDETIESHIHKHLKYFPYECIDCSYDDIKTQFCLDSNAKNHLIDKHLMSNANNFTKKELNSYFDNKMSSITKFDDIFEECAQLTLQIKQFWKNNSKDEPRTAFPRLVDKCL